MSNPSSSQRHRASDAPDNSAAGGDFVSVGDAVTLLRLMGTISVTREDPKLRRQELLVRINQTLNANVSAAFSLKNVDDAAQRAIVLSFEAGFALEEQRQAFRREFATAPFRDPLSRRAFERLQATRVDTLTFLRADLVDDRAWDADGHVLAYRRPAGLGDCVLSIQRGMTRGDAHVLLAFRPATREPAPGSPNPGANLMAASRFGPRERMVLDTLHRGLDWLYRAEESAQRGGVAASLPPRLRQTLEYLLAGDTERQVAAKMSLSIHTVHDYVKALYARFGVSSRGELLAKWIQSNQQGQK